MPEVRELGLGLGVGLQAEMKNEKTSVGLQNSSPSSTYDTAFTLVLGGKSLLPLPPIFVSDPPRSPPSTSVLIPEQTPMAGVKEFFSIKPHRNHKIEVIFLKDR